jgi:uridine kinase
MTETKKFEGQKDFELLLYQKMQHFSSAVSELEQYEFGYALKNLCPENGWDSVETVTQNEIERLISDRNFYSEIQTRHKVGDKIVMDESILRLTRMLFTGLVAGDYSEEWVKAHFYFDIRGFLFFHRTRYFSDEVLAHFGRKPYKLFEPKQKRFERFQGVGYKDFMGANSEIDQVFIECVIKLIDARGTPVLLTLAGPTAAGKTEIMDRLLKTFEQLGKKITTIEMDNFLMDRNIREENPMGEGSHHLEIFKRCLKDILMGKTIRIPRYDFINATSSHNPDGKIKSGCSPIEIEPADIIFIEGNFPFQMKEISDLIGIKVVYLTGDPIRLKRKWKRDIDYRKKYDPIFFVNRFFKTQFLRAEDCYLPQMKVCDIVVDTTGAALWVTPEIAKILK